MNHARPKLDLREHHELWCHRNVDLPSHIDRRGPVGEKKRAKDLWIKKDDSRTNSPSPCAVEVVDLYVCPGDLRGYSLKELRGEFPEGGEGDSGLKLAGDNEVRIRI